MRELNGLPGGGISSVNADAEADLWTLMWLLPLLGGLVECGTTTSGGFFFTGVPSL